MAGTMGHSVGGSSGGDSSMQRIESGELTEWRSSEQLECGTPSTSPPYWDSDDEDDSGLKPSDLYGKFTWKIEKFPQINKRELRSNAFEVGGYKWYILIYPQGCDVCNHLSLFLCVANHDKLLPGWSHFAQFTISVVNKDPKKSKYSDTLHRFWKKEHDWGWKKFMELSKVLDGFLDDDTLIIKAQVQVIREKVNRPFRCLDCQYRRELVRVYLTNVEQICRRFVEERRIKLLKLIEDEARWTSFCTFWQQVEESAKQWMAKEKTDIILKIVVKHFFIEKEVTSTLVMDSLYSGLKALEGRTSYKKGSGKALKLDETPPPIVRVENDMFVLVDDVLPLLERAAMEPLPPKDEKGPQNRTKDGSSGDDSTKDTVERDERRLTELGRRTVEIFILAHIFCNKIEVAYQEAVALRRQEDLIREEAESEKKPKQRSTEKEKKSKKKQAKQKKSNRKAKDKLRDERSIGDVSLQENLANDMKGFVTDVVLPIIERPDGLDDKSDISDSVEFVHGEAQQSDSEERDASPGNWDTDTSEHLPSSEACEGSFSLRNGSSERKTSPRMDDSSSTCSTDSMSSVPVNNIAKGNSYPQYKETTVVRQKNLQHNWNPDGPNRVNGISCHPSASAADAGHLNNSSGSYKVATSAELESSALSKDINYSFEQQIVKKDAISPPRKLTIKDKTTRAPSSPMTRPKISVTSPPTNLLSPNTAVSDLIVGRKNSSQTAVPNGQSVKLVSVLPGNATPRTEHKTASASTQAEKPHVHQGPLLSRPSSAPIFPGPRPAAPAVSVVKATPQLARSVSVAGRLGPPDSLSSSAHSFIPQSYRNAMMGNTEDTSLASFTTGPSSLPAYINPSASASTTAFLTSMDSNSISSGYSFGVSAPGMFSNGTQWMESSLRDNISRSPYAEPSSLASDMQNLNLRNYLRNASSEYLPNEFQAHSLGRQLQYPPPDDFPHIDIINDLLDDELVIRNTASSSGSFHSFTSGSGNCNGSGSFQHLLNRQLSYPGEIRAASELGSSTSSLRLGRTQSYHDDGSHRSYSSFSSGSSPFDLARDCMPQGNNNNTLNHNADGYYTSQWQLPVSDMHSPQIIQNTGGEGYTYHRVPEYLNLTGGVDGYQLFRSANGH